MKRKILTTEGDIIYSRYVLRPMDGESASILKNIYNVKTIIPLDIVLGIPNLPFKVSIGMMLEIAYWAVKLSSYQDAENYFLRTKNISISNDTIREIVNYVGAIVYEADCYEAENARKRLESCTLNAQYNKEGVLYLMTDGAALNTRTKNCDGSTWKENKLAVAFSDDNIFFWKNKKGERQHKIGKREYITLIGNVQDFKYHIFALAQRNGYGKFKNTVLISDGAAWIRNLKEELFPDAQQILDLFHLKENTYEFAKDIFNNDERQYMPWAENICSQLEEGKWKNVLEKLKPYRGRTAKPGCVNLYTYITNNKDNIDYPAYKAKGWFVGSGAIESGNKIVLQNRLKLPGMRWNVSTAQYVLSLKAKLESGLWDSYVIPLVAKKMSGEQ